MRVMLRLERHVSGQNALYGSADSILMSMQRLKGAIDSRIAEEQARQRLSQASPSRSASNAGRSTSRNLSPSKKASRQSARGRQDGDPSSKGPDPADFEPELVIDDDDYSRSGIPRPPTNDESIITGEKTAQETSRGESSQESGEATTSVEEPRVSSDLPTDVRVKLRKLEKLESRYHGAWSDWRIEHHTANFFKNCLDRIVSPMLESLLSSLSRYLSEKTHP